MAEWYRLRQAKRPHRAQNAARTWCSPSSYRTRLRSNWRGTPTSATPVIRRKPTFCQIVRRRMEKLRARMRIALCRPTRASPPVAAVSRGKSSTRPQPSTTKRATSLHPARCAICPDREAVSSSSRSRRSRNIFCSRCCPPAAVASSAARCGNSVRWPACASSRSRPHSPLRPVEESAAPGSACARPRRSNGHHLRVPSPRKIPFDKNSSVIFCVVSTNSGWLRAASPRGRASAIS